MQNYQARQNPKIVIIPTLLFVVVVFIFAKKSRLSSGDWMHTCRVHSKIDMLLFCYQALKYDRLIS